MTGKTIYICMRCGVVIQSEKHERKCELCGGRMEKYSYKKLFCPYCHHHVSLELPTDDMLTSEDRAAHTVARCEHCGASVRLHRATAVPMGRLGDQTLKEMRIEAHDLLSENIVAEIPRHISGKRRKEIIFEKKKELYREVGAVVHLSQPYWHFSCMDYFCLDKAIEYLKNRLFLLHKKLKRTRKQIGKEVC